MANVCLYKVFLSTAYNKVSALLFSSLLYANYYKMRPQNIFYLRGLLELFPPIYLPYSMALKGLSSLQIGSRSQPYKTLKAYLPTTCAKEWLHDSTA
jgi:hypothetical protein